MDNEFWDKYYIPVQDQHAGIEQINPAEAYRRLADAVNRAGPLYAEIETLENRLSRVDRVLSELRSRILAQNMPLSSTNTRTTDLIEAFVFEAASRFETPEGEIRNVQESLMKLHRRKSQLEDKISHIRRRIKSLEFMAEKCDQIMNWVKFSSRLDTKLY